MMGTAHKEMTVRAVLLIIFLCLLFGGNGVAMKLSYTGLGPFTTAGFRFSLASILLISWSFYKKVPLKLGRRQWRLILVLSLIFCCQVSSFHLGLAYTTASHGAIISNALPFLVLILAHLFIPGDRITLQKGVGIALGFAGVVVLFLDRQEMMSGLYKGDFIVLFAVVCWSVSATYVKRINPLFNPVQLTLYPMLLSLPVFFINGWIWDPVMICRITPTVVKAVVYQGAVTAAFGFVAWNTMLKIFGASILHSFIFIVPLAGVGFGVIILNEPLTPHLTLAVACIVSGIVIVNLKRPGKVTPVH